LKEIDMTKPGYLYALPFTVLVSLAACASHPPAQNTAQSSPPQNTTAQNSPPQNTTAQNATHAPNDDASINQRVETAVNNVQGVHENDVHASTQDAVVTLKGSVDNRLVATYVIQAARQVEGVKQVNYNIKLRS
jgi:osmotically-inducible protein OsmY